MRFEKVDFEVFAKYFDDQEYAKEAYDNIRMPQRATPGSAGYDFFLPRNYFFHEDIEAKVPSGVRVILDPGHFLLCVPRSSCGVKYGMRLLNTIGIIDEDFVNGDTGGHIFFPLVTDRDVLMRAGDRFMQGIILSYDVVEDDSPINNKRTGGCGSTGG